MNTKKIKCNWYKLSLEAQLIVLAVITHNQLNLFNDGFNFLNVITFLLGLSFIFVMLYLRNLEKIGKNK